MGRPTEELSISQETLVYSASTGGNVSVGGVHFSLASRKSLRKAVLSIKNYFLCTKPV